MIPATSGKRNIARILEVYVTAFLPLLFAHSLESQQQSHENDGTKYFIERTEIAGYRRIQITTIQAHILSRPGDSYNAEVVQRDAQALRDTGYFVEVRLTVEDSPDQPGGKIVAFVVCEKPLIRRVEYSGIKSITESDILHAYRESKTAFSVGSQFDETNLARAAAIIKEQLSKNGRPSAVVKPRYERNSNLNVVSVLFNEGPNADAPGSPR